MKLLYRSAHFLTLLSNKLSLLKREMLMHQMNSRHQTFHCKAFTSERLAVDTLHAGSRYAKAHITTNIRKDRILLFFILFCLVCCLNQSSAKLHI